MGLAGGQAQVEYIEFNDSSVHKINYETASLELIQSAVVENVEDEEEIIDQTEILTDNDETTEEVIAEIFDEVVSDSNDIENDVETIAEVVESVTESEDSEDDVISMASLAVEYLSEESEEEAAISDESSVMDEIDNMVNLAIQDMSEASSGNVTDSEDLFENSSSGDYDQLWVSGE